MQHCIDLARKVPSKAGKLPQDKRFLSSLRLTFVEKKNVSFLERCSHISQSFLQHTVQTAESTWYLKPLQPTSSHFNPLQATSSHFKPLQATSSHFKPLEVTSSHKLCRAQICRAEGPGQSFCLRLAQRGGSRHESMPRLCGLGDVDRCWSSISLTCKPGIHLIIRF